MKLAIEIRPCDRSPPHTLSASFFSTSGCFLRPFTTLPTWALHKSVRLQGHNGRRLHFPRVDAGKKTFRMIHQAPWLLPHEYLKTIPRRVRTGQVIHDKYDIAWTTVWTSTEVTSVTVCFLYSLRYPVLGEDYTIGTLLSRSAFLSLTPRGVWRVEGVWLFRSHISRCTVTPLMSLSEHRFNCNIISYWYLGIIEL